VWFDCGGSWVSLLTEAWSIAVIMTSFILIMLCTSLCVYIGLSGMYWLTRQCCLMYVPAAQAQWVSTTPPPLTHTVSQSVSRSVSFQSTAAVQATAGRVVTSWTLSPPAAAVVPWWSCARCVVVALTHSECWLQLRVCSRLYASFSLFIVTTFFVPRNGFGNIPREVVWYVGGTNFYSLYQCLQ